MRSELVASNWYPEHPSTRSLNWCNYYPGSSISWFIRKCLTLVFFLGAGCFSCCTFRNIDLPSQCDCDWLHLGHHKSDDNSPFIDHGFTMPLWSQAYNQPPRGQATGAVGVNYFLGSMNNGDKDPTVWLSWAASKVWIFGRTRRKDFVEQKRSSGGV